MGVQSTLSSPQRETAARGVGGSPTGSGWKKQHSFWGRTASARQGCHCSARTALSEAPAPELGKQEPLQNSQSWVAPATPG